MDDKNIPGFNGGLAAHFNHTIDSMALLELPLLDRSFPWSNKCERPTHARLDHALVNNTFGSTFPNASLNSRVGITSDHVPLVTTIPTAIPKPATFQLENTWLNHPDFLPTVTLTWESTVSPNLDAAGTLVARAKALRCAARD
ncbi:uncharacterized protein [Miscanthus floridulus]|uniref:uncharacterized protein n=1 Tax=Miscanthus floridulus TaxID=154761 RepID=UPI0034581073